ncbi:ABC transporter substrate-binding protein [Shewanella waksmanii]|uniref:ABC transporter substrate-binding protein n=1 Tax=Shewanella waksmanii TaxID=213783 RepID=UPI003736CD02
MNSTLVKGVLLIAVIFITIVLLKPDVLPTSPQRTPVKIALSTTPLSAPIIIAQQLDFFNELDVYVELQPIRGGHLCFEMLINDEVDLATSSESVVMFNSFKRSDFSIITSFVESDNDIKLLSLSTSQLTSAKQLSQKRIGIVKSSASEFFLHAYLIMTGNANTPFTPIYMSPQDLPSALLAGDVDAISIWEPYGYRLHKTHQDQISTLNTKGSYNLSFNLIAKKQHRLSNQQMKNILLALQKASQYIATKPEEAKEVISQYLNISQQQLDWGWNDYIFRLSLNSALISNLQTQARWAKAANLVNDKPLPDYRAFIDDRYLNQVLLTSSAVKN